MGKKAELAEINAELARFIPLLTNNIQLLRADIEKLTEAIRQNTHEIDSLKTWQPGAAEPKPAAKKAT